MYPDHPRSNLSLVNPGGLSSPDFFLLSPKVKTMFSILTFADDLNKKRDGVKIKLAGNSSITVAAHGTPAFFEAFRKSRARLVGDEAPTPEQLQQIAAEAYSETILIGWENLSDLDGDPLVYSKAKAAEVLADPRLERFFELVDTESKRVANFRLAAHESEKKR